MPSVVFSFGGAELPCAMTKVDRSKLYGYTRTLALDEDGAECALATLASDGRTLIGAGGTALATFSPDGLWCDKSQLTPVDLEGNEVKAVPSSLKAPIPLQDTAEIDRFLAHNIRLSYLLEAGDAIDAALAKELDGGAIFSFPFSYRGGISPDVGFLLRGEDGGLWMLVGKPCDIEMVGLEQAGAVVEEDDGVDSGDDSDDLLDFGAM